MSVRNINKFYPIPRKDFEKFLTDTLGIGFFIYNNIIMELEIWKDVAGYEGYYKVSNLGRVKSLERKVKFRTFKKLVKSRILTPRISDSGYYTVNISKDGKGNMKYLARIIAIAFIPNPDNKPQVNHIDGNKINNCISNLEWVTNAENQKHAYKLGLSISKRGYLNGNRKYDKGFVLKIRQMWESGKYKQAQLSKICGCNESYVNAVVSRRIWAHI